MAGYIPIEKQTVAQIKAEIAREQARWHEIYTNGCHDPFYADGVNLELVRNHIIHYVRELKARSRQPEQLSLFMCAEAEDADIELPPEVPQDYMAKPEEIRTKALQTMAALISSPEAQFVMRHPPLDAAGEKTLHLNVYQNNYFTNLECAIQKDDYVTMRRYGDTDYWLSAYHTEASKLRSYLSSQVPASVNDPAG